MEKSLVPVVYNELCITNVEFQGCFIKIWANSYSKKQENLEKNLQNYTSYSKELTELDLYGNTVYVYIWKHNSIIRVYRCQVISSDLIEKTHTIVLVDYGKKLVVPYVDVRELIKNIDQSLLIGLSQRITVLTFFLSEYICLQNKLNNVLTKILCNKYYNYRRDFEVGGMTFVTLYNVDNRILDIGVISHIDVGAMMSIARSMPLLIASKNKNDMLFSCPIPSKSLHLSVLKSQSLVYSDYIDVVVTQFAVDNNIILLTIRTIDSNNEVLNSMLNALDRQNLKLITIIEPYTSCLVFFHGKLVRAIIIDAQIDKLYLDLVDYGIKAYVSRAEVFQLPPNLNLIETRSLNVILEKPNNVIVDKSMFIEKYFIMMSLKIDPKYGLYKVNLFKKINNSLINVYNTLSIVHDHNLSTTKSPELFSITEINENLKSIDSSRDTSINSLKNTPIMSIIKEVSEDNLEFVGSLIYYKSPFDFRIKQYSPTFLTFMNQILINLDRRYILTKSDIVKNMNVIFQNKCFIIHRAQIIDVDSNIDRIKLQLIDEGNKIIYVYFDKIILYNCIESDCNIPAQLVLDCSLNNMWFPILNSDITTLLKPYFIQDKLYNIRIVETNEYNIHLVHMVEKDTNIDVSDHILKSGIGQRLCAAMRTDENPYEEALLKGQTFLSYVYNYHFKLYIQPEPNIVNELEEEILEYIKLPYSELLDANSLLGIYCLATINNNQWYRSKVKNINEDSIAVEMFDIGLLTKVSLKQIRPIPNKLMKIPQLGLHCSLETNNLEINITEKTLYKITVQSINANGLLSVSIKEHTSAPLSSPIVRGIEKISFVHVDGDFTYMQRYQDKLKIEKMSETLSKLSGKMVCTNFIILEKVYMFESHGKYYRCVVKSFNSKMVIVHCIDFGFEKRIEKKKLQYLEDTKLASFPAFVIVVKTFPMAFNMSNKTFLTNLHMDTDGTLKATPNKTSSLLHSQNKLIKILENGCLVKITYVYSNNDFWIVPHMFFDKLNTISQVLVKMQSKIIPVETEIGSLCAALHSKSNQWHRALILDGNEENRNVLSIDSGEQFKALKTTRLIGEIQKIPNCALRCQVVSNVDVKTYLNKEVKCKLISFTQPLLEVELLIDNIVAVGMIPTRPALEWTVIISSFESFKEFYVKQFNDNQLNSIADKLEDFTKQPPVGTFVAAITDIGDGVWYECEVLSPMNFQLDLVTSVLVRIINNGSICQAIKIKVLPDYMSSRTSSYQCCLTNNVRDDIITSKNLVNIGKTLMKYHWTMKTTSKNEPYQVSLTKNGLDCIELLCKSINDPANPGNIELSEININGYDTDNIVLSEININGHDMNNIESTDKYIMKNLSNDIPKDNSIKKDIILPDIETVIVKQVDTFQYFYVYSKSLSELYMEKINSNLEICIIQLPLNFGMIGTIVVTSSKNLNCWCRATIDKIHSDGLSAHCYMVDYGIYEDCNKFYKPTDFLCACPPIVRRCSLYAPCLINKKNEIWFSDIDDMFKDIININNVQFNMTIKKDGDPCLVNLLLDDSEVNKMLHPIYVQVTYIKSLVDFKIKALSSQQKIVEEFINNYNVKVDIKTFSNTVKTPVADTIYLAHINSHLKRVQFDSFSGIKYMVFDIDDTLELLPVDNLYELPQNIHGIPVFTMSCSLILSNQEQYSLDKFCALVNRKSPFIMCIITESNSKVPNLVKLYLDNKDVLDILKIE